MSNKIQKWLKWEFWPFWFFYIPVYALYIWLGIKARCFGFFTAANPSMYLGGFSAYSKHGILQKISPNYLPATILLKSSDPEIVLERLKTEGIGFPIILKPDLGERGFAVEKIDHPDGLRNYFNKGPIDELILQEYVSYPIELGVMYSRKASESQGKITSVVMKEFLKIKGDGTRRFQEIIQTDPRAKFYQEGLRELYKDRLTEVIPKGKELELVAIGNHCRGTTFLNANHLINPALHRVFDQIAVPIEGYHFGRFDLRVPSLEDLYQGQNIKIMELNGAASEPAHIYDPNMPLMSAYRDLFAHWRRLYEISIQNHQNGTPYHSAWEVIRAIRGRGQFKKTIK